MRLFLIWYQILMDNATDECHKTYKGLVPPLGLEKDGLDLDIFTVRTSTDSKDLKNCLIILFIIHIYFSPRMV